MVCSKRVYNILMVIYRKVKLNLLIFKKNNNIMKRSICLMVLVSMFLLTNAQEQKTKFTMMTGIGVSNFFNNSGVSLIKSDKDNYVGYMAYANIGITNKYFGEIYLNLFGNRINMVYSPNLEENNLLNGIGIYEGIHHKVMENIYCGIYLGIGLLLSNSKVYYLNNEYTLNYRFGGYAKFNLSLEYKIDSKSSFGINSGIMVGRLKEKSLPSELSAFQDNNINGIYNYFTNIFLKIRI